jgi:hypothetical protein
MTTKTGKDKDRNPVPVLVQPEGTIENITNPDEEIVAGDYIRVWMDNGEFLEKRYSPAQSGSLLTVNLDKTKVSVGEEVSVSVAVTLGVDGPVLPVTDTYYVPIIRCSDDMQAEFLEFVLTDGTGTASFALPEKGMYKMDMKAIFPEPQSELAEVPKVIVV